MTARRYDDPCGIARALDAVGDRWTLLLIRELTFGPKRFIQLRHGLHGVSPNVLSQRLRDLEDGGIVHREVLDPPASVAVYELTPRGRALEPILLELGRWGSQELPPPAGELSASALLLALKTLFDPAAAADATFALSIDGDWFTMTVASSSIDITHGRTEHPAVTFETDAATLRSVAFGREPITAAERDGRLTVHGSRYLAERFTRMFPAPARPATPMSQSAARSRGEAGDTTGTGSPPSRTVGGTRKTTSISRVTLATRSADSHAVTRPRSLVQRRGPAAVFVDGGSGAATARTPWSTAVTVRVGVPAVSSRPRWPKPAEFTGLAATGSRRRH